MEKKPYLYSFLCKHGRKQMRKQTKTNIGASHPTPPLSILSCTKHRQKQMRTQQYECPIQTPLLLFSPKF